MAKERSGSIVAAVTLAIALAFVVIGLLFLRERVRVSVQYAETDADLYEAELNTELESYMNLQYALVGSSVLDEDLASVVRMEQGGASAHDVARLAKEKLSGLTNGTSTQPFVAFAQTGHLYFADGSYLTIEGDDTLAWLERVRSPKDSGHTTLASGPYAALELAQKNAGADAPDTDAANSAAAGSTAVGSASSDLLIVAGRPLSNAENLEGVVGVGVEPSSLGQVLDSKGSTGSRASLCFMQDGTILFASSNARASSGNVFEVYPEVAEFQSSLTGDPQEHLRKWVGLDTLLPREQVLYEICYDEESSHYALIIDHAQSIFDEMRARASTLALALIVVMLLLLLMVVGIVRWYRSRLIRAATTDELTGLANRKSFVASYESLLESSQLDGSTLILVDVDKFKQINDTYGHAAGDVALSSVAAEVRKAAGRDGLAGRWGGDEFIAVLHATAGEAHGQAQALIDRVSQLELAGGIHVTISVGSAIVDVAQPLERIVENADDALYSTKRGGRGYLTEYREGITPHAGDKFAVQDSSAPEAAPAPASAPTADSRRTPRSSDAAKRGHEFWETAVLCLLEAVHQMVPFVAGGGILIAIAFLIDGASVDLGSLSEEARSGFGSITPIANNLHTVGAAAFNFMLPIFAAFFARSLAGEEAFMAGFAGGYLSSQSGAGFVGAVCAAVVSATVVSLMRGFVKETHPAVRRVAPVLVYPVFSLLVMSLLMTFVITPVAVAFEAALTSMLELMETRGHAALGAACGAMMATDMGGPINKAAYHFGVASIAAGSPDIMASVMVGGMVPPCGIALCVLLFKGRFTDAEHDQVASTFVMGLSFITEGAIAFALTDPLRVIPACMAGSALAGALSSLFGCTLMAPHGGIFVFPVVGNAPMYCAALLAGSVLCAVVLGLLKLTRKRGVVS